MNIIVWMQLHPTFSLTCLCPGFCKEDWSGLPESLEISVSTWTWMDRPLSWFGLTKRGTSVCSRNGGKTVIEKLRCGGPSLVFRGTAEMFSPAKHVGLKQKEKPELDFLNVLDWTFETQCTGQFVQLLFAAVSLFFPSGLSKWRFLDLKFPSGQIYTQRRGSGGSSQSIQTVEVYIRHRKCV